jgi:taurine dioxygenase
LQILAGGGIISSTVSCAGRAGAVQEWANRRVRTHAEGKCPLSPALVIRPLSGGFGAEVLALDPTASSAAAGRLRQALTEHHLLVVRGRTLAPAEQIALARVFGEPEVFLPHPTQLPDFPQLRRFSNTRAEGYENRAQYWHSDGTILPNPTAVSLWHVVKQAHGGSVTLFSNTHEAYERLSPEVRAAMEGLKMISRTGAVHSVVQRHPVTGRPALYISVGLTRGFVGLDQAASKRMLDHFDRHFGQPGTYYAHRWREGDVIIGDNFSVAHRGMPADPGAVRTLHRVTVGLAEMYYRQKAEVPAG